MSSDGARVVIAIPAWEAAEFITTTLASVAAQSWTELRVLVSVDASRDETTSVCRDFAATDPRFAILEQPRRLGWIENTNAVVEAAQGEFIALVSHDDSIAPDFVERLVGALDARPDAVLAFGDLEQVDARGRLLHVDRYEPLEGLTDPVARAREVIRGRGAWFVPFHGLGRLPVVRSLGGLRPHAEGEFAADQVWLLGMALRGALVRVPQVLYTKANTERNLSRDWNGSDRSRMSALLHSHVECIGSAPLPWFDRWRLRRAVSKRIARNERKLRRQR